jgi:sulfite exporter TauE/SafE
LDLKHTLCQRVGVTWLAIFAGGLAGSLHCVGMCGVFPLALSGGAPEGRWRRQVLYNVGRVNTLVALGALAGFAGAAIVASGPVAWAGRALALAGGAFMVAVGLEMLGLVRGVTGLTAVAGTGAVGRTLASVAWSRSPAAPVALGVMNAFLPCQLVWAFAARAAATGSVGEGMAVMLAFGLGTVPALLLVGRGSDLVPRRARALLVRLAAWVVIGFGVVTALRGIAPAGGHVHAAQRAIANPISTTAVSTSFTSAMSALPSSRRSQPNRPFHTSAPATIGGIAA